VRDQAETPFATILSALCETAPYVKGAALVDSEGETVDYAGSFDPTELRIVAATWQLPIAQLSTQLALRSLRVRTSRSGYVLVAMPDGYALVVVLRALGVFALSSRLVSAVEAELLDEAGLAADDRGLDDTRPHAWGRAQVELDAVGRPCRVKPVNRGVPAGSWQSVHVLGIVVGLDHRSRGYRIRLQGGAEKTLVCESQRHWYIDGKLPPHAVG
jgi:hypothetical protein